MDPRDREVRELLESAGRSAWAGESRDEAGGTWARVSDAFELAMGGPTCGALTTNRGFACSSASPSLRLSPDGERLAYVEVASRQEPYLDDRGRKQFMRRIEFIVVVQDLVHDREVFRRRPCGVVVIAAFDGRKLELIQSPKSAPVHIEIDLSEL